MVTTCFLLMVVAFELWYLTSTKVKHNQAQALKAMVSSNKTVARVASIFLIVVASITLTAVLGLASGLAGALLALMTAGCLIVLLQPFNYLGFKSTVGLYLLFAVLEYII